MKTRREKEVDDMRDNLVMMMAVQEIEEVVGLFKCRHDSQYMGYGEMKIHGKRKHDLADHLLRLSQDGVIVGGLAELRMRIKGQYLIVTILDVSTNID